MASHSNHPKEFSECIKKDLYDRDLKELKKDIDEIYRTITRKQKEMQHEVNYKCSNNQKLCIWIGGISLAISGYLFTQVENVRIALTSHSEKLWHAGSYELLKVANQDIMSLMCKTFGIC